MTTAKNFTSFYFSKILKKFYFKQYFEKEAKRKMATNYKKGDNKGKNTVRYEGDGMDLTEEDIFSMKKLRPLEQGSIDPAEQSVMSVADSASNFGEHVPDEMDGGPLEDDRTDNEIEDSLVASDKDDKSPSNHFVFDRDDLDQSQLPTGTVTQLSYPFEPLLEDGEEDDDELTRAITESKVFLIGTAHFSIDSQNDVLNTIKIVQPDIVMVELCPSRIGILSSDEESLLAEAQNMNYKKMKAIIKESGFVNGITQVLLLSMAAHVTKQLGMAPGGEFRAAYRGCQKVKGCRLLLGDRPIQVTLQRALGALSLWQRVRIFWHILISHNAKISKEDVERCKQHDLLEEILQEMAGHFPELSRIFVYERDLFMANGLRNVLHRMAVAKMKHSRASQLIWQPLHIVAVVGMGHVPGITSNWTKPIDVSTLLSIPKSSRWTRLTIMGIKGALLGSASYILYKVARFAIEYQKIF